MINKQKVEDSLLAGPESLIGLAEMRAPEDLGGYEELREVLLSSSYPHKLEAAKLPSGKFVSMVILLLAYSAIDPNLIETPIFKKYQDTVFQACKVLEVDTKLISPVSTIENAIYQILERF